MLSHGLKAAAPRSLDSTSFRVSSRRISFIGVCAPSIARQRFRCSQPPRNDQNATLTGADSYSPLIKGVRGISPLNVWLVMTKYPPGPLCERGRCLPDSSWMTEHCRCSRVEVLCYKMPILLSDTAPRGVSSFRRPSAHAANLATQYSLNDSIFYLPALL
jgi:hypothetical protein